MHCGQFQTVSMQVSFEKEADVESEACIKRYSHALALNIMADECWPHQQ